MPEKLNVAIVGCGIGEEHLSHGFARAPDLFDVRAVCDLDPRRLADVAARHDVPETTTRFEDLLGREDIDVIDICTPPGLHHDQTAAALRAGKHVICEKPLVRSLSELDGIEAIAAHASRLVMPIFQYRFGTGVAQARHLIESGLAGKPYLATAETFWRRDMAYYANGWRGRWHTELGGVLTTQAIHIHDLLTHLMGPVDRLFGRIATRVNPIEVDDCATASVQLASGALATMSATLGSRDQLSRLRLMFENVTIESSHDAYAPGRDPWTFVPRDVETGRAIDAALAAAPDTAQGFEGQFRGFHRSVTQGDPLPVTTGDARRALEIATAFYHSAHSREDVSLPLGPGHPAYGGWTEFWAGTEDVA
ncbi:Gfo/Idh/MocA family oxidoreductase [Palleronia sp. LCG004]|uniref:Gfo/Idh/MocA family protein n=1 Tax=Palleronia sp. LCG004 TaxID=3079304 RepID=UPI0029421D04|nr:Gfo/Idh/MocA family oxidoreductase [Palleronia sp. LCG004]WOI55867.1 Gfo/Idh/MocA family oxidoreductase [Palleronia sp. LCG004]